MSILIARWAILSSKVGMPIGLICPLVLFGMSTWRTGGARYFPDLRRSSRDNRFSRRLQLYSTAVW